MGVHYSGDSTTSNLTEIAGTAIEAASEFVTTVGGEIFVLEIKNG